MPKTDTAHACSLIISERELYMSWDWWHNFSPVFRDITLGIASIPIVYEWLKQIRKSSYRKYWQTRLSYSHFRAGDFVLLKNSKGDEIYAVDKSDTKKWWIRNPSTLHDLGYTGKNAEDATDKILDLYDDGRPINFY